MTNWLDNLPAKDQAAYIDAALAKIRGKLEMTDMKRFLVGGAVAGAGGYGLYHLGNTLAKALNPPSSSYTTPVEAVVYRPDREKKRRRSKAATAPTPNPMGLVPTYTPLDRLREDNPRGLAAAVIAAAIGIPTGVYAAKRLSQGASRVARHSELEQAQREFEQALQEYAEAGDRPKRVEKRASMQQSKVAALAENCFKLALWKELPAWYLAYAAGTGLLGGVTGFSQAWGQRASKDLSTAERMLNQQREKTNPTFTVAKLKNPPDLDKKPTDPEEEAELKRSVRESIESVLENFDTDYM